MKYIGSNEQNDTVIYEFSKSEEQALLDFIVSIAKQDCKSHDETPVGTPVNMESTRQAFDIIAGLADAMNLLPQRHTDHVVVEVTRRIKVSVGRD